MQFQSFFLQTQANWGHQSGITSGTSLSEEKPDSTPARTRTLPSDATPVAKTVQRPNGLRNAGRNNGNAHRVTDMNLEKGGSGRVPQGDRVLDRAHALKNTTSMVLLVHHHQNQQL